MHVPEGYVDRSSMDSMCRNWILSSGSNSTRVKSPKSLRQQRKSTHSKRLAWLGSTLNFFRGWLRWQSRKSFTLEMKWNLWIKGVCRMKPGFFLSRTEVGRTSLQYVILQQPVYQAMGIQVWFIQKQKQPWMIIYFSTQ